MKLNSGRRDCVSAVAGNVRDSRSARGGEAAGDEQSDSFSVAKFNSDIPKARQILFSSAESFPLELREARQIASWADGDELAICRSSGMSPRQFAAAKSVNGKATAIAAGARVLGSSPSVGFFRAHQEVDRAHDAAYADSADHGDACAKAPDFELLKVAISELQAFDLDREEQTYRLLNGVMHAMCLLGRVAPDYADIDE
jgi:hypothetical protein